MPYFLERAGRIELPASGWKPEVLPLYDARNDARTTSPKSQAILTKISAPNKAWFKTSFSLTKLGVFNIMWILNEIPTATSNYRLQIAIATSRYCGGFLLLKMLVLKAFLRVYKSCSRLEAFCFELVTTTICGRLNTWV